jgi:hypothetical protein
MMVLSVEGSSEFPPSGNFDNFGFLEMNLSAGQNDWAQADVAGEKKAREHAVTRR